MLLKLTKDTCVLHVCHILELFCIQVQFVAAQILLDPTNICQQFRFCPTSRFAPPAAQEPLPPHSHSGSTKERHGVGLKDKHKHSQLELPLAPVRNRREHPLSFSKHGERGESLFSASNGGGKTAEEKPDLQSEAITFLHITDIHLDTQYTAVRHC